MKKIILTLSLSLIYAFSPHNLKADLMTFQLGGAAGVSGLTGDVSTTDLALGFYSELKIPAIGSIMADFMFAPEVGNSGHFLGTLGLGYIYYLPLPVVDVGLMAGFKYFIIENYDNNPLGGYLGLRANYSLGSSWKVGVMGRYNITTEAFEAGSTEVDVDMWEFMLTLGMKIGV